MTQGTAADIVTRRVTCSLDCPDSCGIIATVDTAADRVIRIQGDPSHPVTRGFLCGKVAKYLDRVYSPDRVLYPMRRKPGVAKQQLKQGKELDAFERITWDEALNEIARRLQHISDEHGPESILPYSYAGTIGQLGYGSMDRRFFHRLGASQLDRTICASAGSEALNVTYGIRLGTQPQDFAHSKLIIAWGANIHGNSIHLWPFIEQARRNGARLVVIDPYATRTARLADWHIPINPGTDAALALGIMQVLIRDGLTDPQYIAECTHGFDQLRDRAMQPEYAAENVARLTGMTAEEVERLARMYGTTKPAVIRMNYGVQRSDGGGTASRAISMLPLFTGSWKHRGGGLMLSTSGGGQWNGKATQMPELMQASPLGRETRTVNMSRLGHALTELGSNDEEGPRVHALFVYNSNPAAVAPNQNAVLAGMVRHDLFTVVHDQFFTDTCDFADYILPAPSFLEQTDIQSAYGHYFVQLSDAAMSPLGEARNNVSVFGELAQRMGFTEPCFQDTEDDIIQQALSSGHPWMHGITLDALRKDPRIAISLPRNAEGDLLPYSDASWFRTPTGKAELYSTVLERRGLDPLPAFHPSPESRHGAARNSRFPLELLARKADNWMNSTFANIPTHRDMEADHLNTLEISAPDAAARNIADGATVRVTNTRGSITLHARITEHVRPGVVSARLGWNKLAEDGNGINVLTSERLTDLGDGATFYSVMVEVAPV